MTDIKKSVDPAVSLPKDIIVAAQQHVLKLFNNQSGSRLLYHNYQRASALVALVASIGQGSGYSAEVIEIAQLGAWFQGVGCLEDFNNFENRSVIQTRIFLEGRNYPSHKLNRVLAAINASKPEVAPRSTDAELLSDAVTAFDFSTNYLEINPLVRLERELVLNEKLSTLEWEQKQLTNLLDAKFFTPYGKLNYEPVLAQNILTQKNILEKGRAKALQSGDEDGEFPLRKFQNIERKVPRAGIQTFFRSNYRNHINLSVIADNKANIMISVNAIVVSLLISILTYKDVTTTAPVVLLPVVTFLITGLTSLVFAVLSIRPKVTELNNAKTPKPDVKKNIVFFGNFVHLDLEEYEEAMDAMFRDSELMYGNMTRDLYYLGKVLDKKYRYLTNSYNIFMVGFIATVLTFLVTMFTQA